MSDQTPGPDGIQTILFDLDGTLRHSRPSYNDEALDMAIRLGAQDGAERRHRALRWVHYYWANSPEVQRDFKAFQKYDAFMSNYVRRFLLAFDCPETQAAALAPQIAQHLAENHAAEDWVEPSTPDALAALQVAGYRLGVVSNRHKPYHEQLETLGLLRFFEFTLAAGEVNSWKPDGVIFAEALARADSRAAHTLYVGDNYYADVVGARNAGLHAVLLDPNGLFPDADCPVITSLEALNNLEELLDLKPGVTTL